MSITIDGVVREKEKKPIGMSNDKKEDNDHHHIAVALTGKASPGQITHQGNTNGFFVRICL